MAELSSVTPASRVQPAMGDATRRGRSTPERQPRHDRDTGATDEPEPSEPTEPNHVVDDLV